MKASELVQAAMKATGCTSARQIAEKCGASNVSASKWLKDEVCPTFEQACELAVLAGLPPVSTAAGVRQGSIDGARHRRILRQLASLAAGVALAVGVVPAHAGTLSPAHNLPTLYIMSNWIRRFLRIGTMHAWMVAFRNGRHSWPANAHA